MGRSLHLQTTSREIAWVQRLEGLGIADRADPQCGERLKSSPHGSGVQDSGPQEGAMKTTLAALAALLFLAHTNRRE